MTRVARGLGALLVAAMGVPLLVPAISPAAASGAVGSAVSISKKVTRTHLEGGTVRTADARSVTLSVSQTRGLVDRQRLSVSWKGAHPTAFIASNERSQLGAGEAYPFVLLQCRGRDDASLPPEQQVRPETCYTQNTAERFPQTVCCDVAGSRFPAWRLDRMAKPAQRSFRVGAPSPRPADCKDRGYPEYWLHFRSPTTTYLGGEVGCAGYPPESIAQSDAALDLPGNGVYGVTAPDGSGSTLFDVRTRLTNASLGCSDKVACSLVAVPVLGISCDADDAQVPADDRPRDDAEARAAASACEADTSTSGDTGTAPLTVTGALWWSASNWRNRITVPLSFQPLPGGCEGSTKQGPLLYGSEMLSPLTGQWQNKFCLDPALFPFKHVQTGDPLARNLLRRGAVQSDLTSFTDGPASKPVATGPVALGGFAIGFAFNYGASHTPVHTMRLNARLIAKLLAESYPAQYRDQHFLAVDGKRTTPLRGNPLGLFADPEFTALNPAFVPGPGDPPAASNYGATGIQFLASDSDLVRAVTSYINADPEARAWLDGKPDPWGMAVNPAYRGIELPRSSWPLLDTWSPTSDQSAYQGVKDCVGDGAVPLLPLGNPPVSRLASLTQHLEYPFSTGQLCVTLRNETTGDLYSTFKPLGLLPSNAANVIALTTLSDAARYGIDVADLRSGSGNRYVHPSDASLRAAAALLKPSPSTPGLWSFDYAAAAKDAGGGAYPGLVPVHLQAPAQGLPPALARQLATLLRFAARDGQVPGDGPGQLPPGFLPLTGQLGGRLVASTLAAASIVEAQRGGVPVASGGAGTAPPGEVGRAGSGSSGATLPGGSFPNPAGPGVGAPAASGGAATPGNPSAAGSDGKASPAVPQTGGARTTPPRRSPTTKAPNPAALSVPTPDLSLGVVGAVVPGLLVLALAGVGLSGAVGRRRP